MHRRARIRLWWATSALLCLTSLASSANAQDADPAQAARNRDRYEQVLLKNPQPGTAFDRLYKSYADAGELDAWLTHLADKAKAAPTPKDAGPYHLITGHLLQRRAQDAQALEAFDKAVNADPTNPRAFAARGLLLAKTGKNQPAAESLAKAISLNPPKQELQDLYKALGRAHAAAGQPDNAVKAWLALADLFPDDTAMREELAGLLIQEGRLPEAAAQYEKLRASTQDAYQKVRATFALAQIASAQNKPDQAIGLLSDQLASLAPESWLRAETHRRLELAFTRASADRPALPALADFYAKWTLAHPGDIDVRLVRAGLLRRLNKADDALQAMRDTLAVAPNRADIRTALADLLLEQNKRPEAIALYEKIAADQPSDPVGWERLGHVLLTDPSKTPDQQKQTALAVWRNIFDKAPQPPDPARALKTADLLRKAALPDQALDYYAKASTLAPDQPEYDEYAGLYLAELGRQTDALARLQKMIAPPRDTPANRLRLAQLLIQLKALPEALAALGNPSEIPNPDTYALESLRVTLLTTLKRFPEALAAIDRLETKFADTPERAREARISRVEFHKSQNTLPQAAQAQAAQTKANPTPDALEMLALYQRAQTQLSDAADSAAESATLDPSSPSRLAFALDLSIESGNLTRAFAQAGLLLQRQPQRRTLYAQALADLIAKSPNPDTALARAKNLITLIPDAPQPYLLLSTLQLTRQDTAGALDTLRQGVRQVPSDTPLLLALARLEASANQPDQARSTYARAYETASDPDLRTQAITELTRLELASGHADAFLQKLAQKARDTDFEPGPTLALAAAAREAGQPDKAQAALEESLLRRPSDAQTLQSLVTLTRAQNLRDQSLQYARRLQELKPEDPQLSQTIAQLLLELGRPQEALALWQRTQPNASTSTASNPADLTLQHARALVQEGNNAQAIQVLTQAVPLFPDNWALVMEAARITEEAGRPEKAAALFDTLLRIPAGPATPNDANAQYPNISYLGFKGRAPSLNRWVNLRSVQTRCVTELNYTSTAGAASGGGRMSAGIMRYNPPDLPSAQLAALVHRLHIAQQIGQVTPYLRALAQEAAYTFSDTPANQPSPQQAAATQPAASRPTRIRFLQALLLLNLSHQAQLAARDFITQDPAFPEAATLDAVLTLSVSANAQNLMLNGVLQAQPQDARDAIALVKRAAPEALSDLALMLAESALARSKKAEAADWLDIALEKPTSLESRISLLGMLVRANDSARASQLLQGILPDAKALSIAKSPVINPVLDELVTISGQALRPQTASLGVDLCLASLDIIASGDGGRAWTQGQPALPTFNLEIFSPLPPSIPLLGGEFQNSLQQWAQQASQQPSMNGALATRSLQWALSAPPSQKAFAALAASTLLRHANLPDDALAVLQDAAKPDIAPNAAPIPGLIDVKLALLHLLLTQQKYTQAQTLFTSLNPGADTDLARQLNVARLYLALATKNLDQVKPLLLQLDTSQNTTREVQSLTRIRKTLGLLSETPSPATPPGATPVLANPKNPNLIPAPQPATPLTDSQALANLLQTNAHRQAQELANRIIAQSARSVLASAAPAEEINYAFAALARINRFDAALAAASAAFNAQPDDPEIAARLLILLNARGDSLQAEAVLAKLVASSPAHLSMRYEYAIFLHTQERFAEAAAQLDHVLSRRPGLIQSAQEVFESYQAANRLPDLVKTLSQLPQVENLTILQAQNQSLTWMLDIAAAIAPTDPKGALAILQRHQTLTNTTPDPNSPINALQLAIAAKDPQAVIQQLGLILSRTTAENPDASNGTRPLLYTPENTLFLPPPNAPHFPIPATAAIDFLAKSGQLDNLEKAFTLLPDPEKDSRIRALRAMIAAKRTPPDLGLVRGAAFPPPSTPSLTAPALSAIALSLPPDPASLKLADEIAAAALTGPKRLVPTFESLQNLPLLDLRARYALSNNAPQDAVTFYGRLLTLPAATPPLPGGPPNVAPWQQNINLYAIALHVRLAYASSAIKAGAVDPAVTLILAVDDILPAVPNADDRAQLERSLAPLLPLPPIQSALEARIKQLENFKPTGPDNPTLKPLLSLYLLTNQPDKAAGILPKILLPINRIPGRDQAFARTRVARLLALSGKGAPARALLLPLITQGNPNAIQNLDHYPDAFADAQALQELAAALQSAPIENRRNARAELWLPQAIDAMRLATSKITDPTHPDAAQKATLQATLAAAAWPTPPDWEHQPVSPATRETFPTQALSLFNTLNQQTQAYPWFRDHLFKPDAAGNFAPPPADLFTVRPDAQAPGASTSPSCPLTDFVALAVKTQNVLNLTETATDALNPDSFQAFIALRTLLLLALQQNDIPSAQKRLTQDFPNPIALEALGFDPSLDILLLTIIDDPALKELLPPALDLYIQSAQTAFATEASRKQALSLLPRILIHLETHGHADLIPAFKERLVKSTNLLSTQQGPPQGQKP